MIQTNKKPFIQVLLPIPNIALRYAIQILLGVTLLALLAQVRIDIGPVPITGQTFAVLLIATAYGFSLGTITIICYLIIGALGLPVFQDATAGLAVLKGTTAGYLFGFIIATALVGYLTQQGWDRNFFSTALAMFLGNILIYVPGLLWLNQFAPDWQTTLQWGLTPFIWGDIIKLLLAAALLPTLWQFMGKDN